MQVKERISRLPALVLDLHDWYAQTFLAPGEVKRPSGPVRVLLTPQNGAAKDSWPFRGEAELVTVLSPAGFVAFFDRARALPATLDKAETPAPLDPPRRLHLVEGNYQARVLGAGFQEATFALTRPEEQFCPVELFPGPTYPFPTGRRPNGLTGPTLLRGTVVNTQGLGMANILMEAPLLNRHCRTDSSGQWLLVLDPMDLTQRPTAQVDLRFGLASGELAIAGFAIAAGTETSFPLTSLRGEVRDGNGLPSGAAVVSVVGQTATSVTRSDGVWAYFFPLTRPRTGQETVTVNVAAADGRTGSTQVNLNNGTMTRVPPIVIE